LAVQEGTLRLNKTVANVAIPSTIAAVSLGDNVGGADADQLVLAASEQVADATTPLTIQSSGKLDLNGFNETVGTTVAVVNGFTRAEEIATGTGTLTISNSTYITASNLANTLGSMTPVLISGNLALQTPGGAAATRTITSGDAIASTDVMITAKITDGD